MCLYAHIADNTNSTSFKKKKLCHKWCSSSDYIVLIKLVRICPFTIAQRRLLTHNWTFRQECVYSITHAYWLGWLIAWCCYKFQKCCISCNTGHLGFYLMCTVCTCWGLWPSGHVCISGNYYTIYCIYINFVACFQADRYNREYNTFIWEGHWTGMLFCECSTQEMYPVALML